nr:lysosomal Pro-X carboxypeptidase-like [Ipomoea batatas]
MSSSGDERASSGGVDLRLPAAIYSSGGGVTVAPVANLWQRQYVSREQYLCLLGHQSSNLSRTFYYTQTLDHFNYAPQSYATFQQRYIVNFKYSSGAQSNSPIFAWLDAEAPIDSNPRAIGFLTDNAPGFKALLVYIEEVSDTCYQTIKQSWSMIIDTIASLSNGLSILSRKFNLCQDLNLALELKGLNLDGMYCAAAQYDTLAQQLVRVVWRRHRWRAQGAAILDRIHAGVVAIKGNKPCYTVSAIEGN